MSNIPVSILKKSLDNKLGKDSWKDYEAETLLLATELPFSSLLLDKLNALNVIENKPQAFFEDVMFLVYCTAVMNNEAVNFSHLPHITSLELAFAIEEMSKILELDLHQLPQFSPATAMYTRDILINEGYSEVLPPFDIVGVGKLPQGQLPQDTADKRRALEEYLHASYR